MAGRGGKDPKLKFRCPPPVSGIFAGATQRGAVRRTTSGIGRPREREKIVKRPAQ